MALKRELLNHFRYVKNELRRHGAHASVDVETFVLRISRGDETIEWKPRFIKKRGDLVGYVNTFDGDVTRFYGWRPDQERFVEGMRSKLATKALWLSKGIRVPPAYLSKEECIGNAVLKCDLSSFGKAVEGPLRSVEEVEFDPDKGDYFESFIPGDIVKIWYWGARPVCYERHAPASVVGDGYRTLHELALAQRNKTAAPNSIRMVEFMARYDGLELDSVIGKGKKQRIDILYASDFMSPNLVTDHKISKSRNMLPQCEALGQVMLDEFPEIAQPNLVWTADAIQDRSMRLWFLEANTNPVMHPMCYRAIFRSVLRGKAAV